MEGKWAFGLNIFYYSIEAVQLKVVLLQYCTSTASIDNVMAFVSISGFTDGREMVCLLLKVLIEWKWCSC